LCPDATVEAIAGWMYHPAEVYVRDTNRQFSAGELIEIYIVTDGPAVLTLRFPEIVGATEIAASTPIDAHLERLPAVQCFISCENYAVGGTTHEVSAPGYAFAVAYALAPNDGPENWLSSGTLSTSAEVCAYPGLFASGASPDPEAHPHGCDGTFDEGSRTTGASKIADFGTSVILVSDARLSHWPNLDAHGDVYLGFMAGQRSPVSATPGSWAAFGIWISGGLLQTVQD
jgi:hypothetical protein